MSYRTSRKTVVLSLITSVVLFGTYAFSPAPLLEEHGEPTDLKVLPKDISHEELMQVMHSFEVALDMNCGDCHTHSATDSSKMDFAADTKQKETTRHMMTMVKEMNAQYFGIKGDFKENYLRSQFDVTCMSCHNGHEKPVHQVSVPIPDPKWQK